MSILSIHTCSPNEIGFLCPLNKENVCVRFMLCFFPYINTLLFPLHFPSVFVLFCLFVSRFLGNFATILSYAHSKNWWFFYMDTDRRHLHAVYFEWTWTWRLNNEQRKYDFNATMEFHNNSELLEFFFWQFEIGNCFFFCFITFRRKISYS